MLKYTTYLRSHFANWPRLAIEAKLRIPHRTITLRNGVTLHGPKDLELLSIAREIFNEHCYCQHGITIDSGSRVLDIGGNIGAFAVYAARAGASCCSFEPFPNNASLYRRNVKANGAQGDCRVIEAALSGATGKARLNLESSGGHSITSVHGDTPSIEVPTYSLADACVLAFGEHATIDLGKIDCEGAEGDILRNATPDCLRRFRQIAMEYHDNASSLKHRELAGLLERAGFRTAVVERPSSPFGFIYAFRPVG